MKRRRTRAIPSTPLVDKNLLAGAHTFKKQVKLLLKTPKNNKEVLQEKYIIKQNISETGGKHGDVFFVSQRKGDSNQIFAVKRQVIDLPKELEDRCYRELRIFQHLNQLAADNKCLNFVEIIEWFKATPNILTPGKIDGVQLMHFVLEYPF